MSEQKPTTAQAATVRQLTAEGFSIDSLGTSIRMKRGNDYRLVQLDGAQKRAMGAKR